MTDRKVRHAHGVVGRTTFIISIVPSKRRASWWWSVRARRAEAVGEHRFHTPTWQGPESSETIAREEALRYVERGGAGANLTPPAIQPHQERAR